MIPTKTETATAEAENNPPTQTRRMGIRWGKGILFYRVIREDQEALFRKRRYIRSLRSMSIQTTEGTLHNTARQAVFRGVYRTARTV